MGGDRHGLESTFGTSVNMEDIVMSGLLDKVTSYETIPASVVARGLKSLELWRRWFKLGGRPTYATEQGGDIYCFFCRAWVEHDPHEASCMWVLVKDLLEIE